MAEENEDFEFEYEENSETEEVATTDEVEEKEEDSAEVAEKQTKSEENVESSELSDEERKHYGQRAQKRIQRLVRDKKDTAQRMDAMAARLAELEQNNTDLVVTGRNQQKSLLTEHQNRLEADEERALSNLRNAKEAGDLDEEIKAQDVLASAKAERLLVRKALQQAEHFDKKQKVQPNQEEVEPQQEQRIDRDALQWQKRNLWFGGQTPKERVMTQVALDIHKDVVESGLYPSEDTDEYYAELDARLQKEFPDEFSSKREIQSPVTGGTRTGNVVTRSGGKRKVKLTRSQVATAKRLGVSPEAYARQVAAIAARS